MSRIQLEQISKSYDGREVLKGIDLDVRAGEFLVILGSSGGGKTTLLNMIAGLLKPASGKIYFDDVEVTHSDVAARNVAYVFQDYALYPHMTVAQNIRFPLENVKRPYEEIAAKTRETLEWLQLTLVKDKYPGQLSGGENSCGTY
ncbi:MAG: ABC transporter ATP-binding protein [Nitrospinales bacterium]